MGINTTVKSMLSQKTIQGIKTISSSASVFEAISLMARHNIGALFVIEESKLLGIIAERDYTRKVILKQRSSQTTKVVEIMEKKLYFVTPSDSADRCLSIMTENRIRHLPVIDNGRFIGIVSMGDIVKTVIEDQTFMIEELTRYVTGTNYSEFPTSL
jgi:CBS domain-containing protein